MRQILILWILFVDAVIQGHQLAGRFQGELYYSCKEMTIAVLALIGTVCRRDTLGP